MVNPPPPTACEALTARRERCRAGASHHLELGRAGRRRLCDYHAHLAHHRPLAYWDRPLDPAEAPDPIVPKRRWTPEDDEQLRTHADEPAAVVALILGRTTWAIWQRRSRLRRQKPR